MAGVPQAPLTWNSQIAFIIRSDLQGGGSFLIELQCRCCNLIANLQ